MQPFQEIALNADPLRKFKVINPELGLLVPPYGMPLLIMEAYEDMFTALFAARDKHPMFTGITYLFYIGHPGIGVVAVLFSLPTYLSHA